MRTFEKLINLIVIFVLFVFLSFSNPRLTDLRDRLHVMVSNNGFDFVTWTSQAIWVKLLESSIASPHYFTKDQQHALVVDYLKTLGDYEETNRKIKLIYSDPAINDPAVAAADLQAKLNTTSQRLDSIAPQAEAILEMQVTQVLQEEGLTTAGQPIPWVLYHSTPLPQNLVISRRDKIGQETNYVLTPISIKEAEAIESSVDKSLNVSSLVVNIGGLAAYPTMIMNTTNLSWLSETIAHEWTHIYLGQRPLGNNYDSPELRTMNETTASIAGTEIGQMVMKRYYPELVSMSSPGTTMVSHPGKAGSQDTSTFDFRVEMHITRVHTDELLAQGKIDEAEAYMEQRRQFFWQNNYAIRKLNQAYFAFYGSYADVPGGAAGEDPVGPAVRALRAQSNSLKEFLEKISQMTTFAQLQQAIARTQ